MRAPLKQIFYLWLPVGLMWFFIAAEAPTVAAIVARFDHQMRNLAAYGSAYAIVLLLESPVLMLLSASTSRVQCEESFRAWRKFSFILSIFMSIVLLLFSLPWVSSFVFGTMANLPPDIGELARKCLLYLVPAPAVIGIRRFYQGVMIKNGDTKRLVFATLLRYIAMLVTGYLLLVVGDVFEGACVGAIALSIGVIVEMIVVVFLAKRSVKHFLKKQSSLEIEKSLLEMGRFYLPLALTTIVLLAIQPFLILYVGHLPEKVESLAVMPVVVAYLFMFRSVGMSLQEIAISWSDRKSEQRSLAVFSLLLALVLTLLLGIHFLFEGTIAWYTVVGGVHHELASFAILPTLILMLMPASEVHLSYVRAKFIHYKANPIIFYGAMLEFAILVVFTGVTLSLSSFNGAIMASVAMMLARVGACLYQQLALMKMEEQQ